MVTRKQSVVILFLLATLILGVGLPSQSQAVSPGEIEFETVEGESKATVRVREQLFLRFEPNDAVLTTSAVTGGFTLLADGNFKSDSKITVGLSTLKSDVGQRDNFVKRNTLETDKFPVAEFIPITTEGLSIPLPATGEWAFKVIGNLTIHGVEREVIWDLEVKRSGADLSATAKTMLKFGDFGMEKPRALVVLSVVDEIRLEIEFISTEKIQ